MIVDVELLVLAAVDADRLGEVFTPLVVVGVVVEVVEFDGAAVAEEECKTGDDAEFEADCRVAALKLGDRPSPVADVVGDV